MGDLSPHLQNKIRELKSWFSKRKGSIVAFSGGIDSTLGLLFIPQISGKTKCNRGNFQFRKFKKQGF